MAGFIFSQFGGAPDTVQQSDSINIDEQQDSDNVANTENEAIIPAAIPELSDESLPPMPAPIENAGTDTDIALNDVPDLNFDLQDYSRTAGTRCSFGSGCAKPGRRFNPSS